jgi:hypothetical protein
MNNLKFNIDPDGTIKLYDSNNKTYYLNMSSPDRTIEDRCNEIMDHILNNSKCQIDPEDINAENNNFQANLEAVLFPKDIEPSVKHKSKQEAKESISSYKIFKRGDIVALKIKPKCCNNRITLIYKIKQIVWTMDEIPINAYVVKQINEPIMGKTFLGVHDCKNLHVKYESGLQLLSMTLGFVTYNNNNNNKNNI